MQHQRCGHKERVPERPSLPGQGNTIPQAPALGCSQGDKSCLHALPQQDEPFGIHGQPMPPCCLPFALHPHPLCLLLLPQPLSDPHKVPTPPLSSQSSLSLRILAIHLTVPRTPPNPNPHQDLTLLLGTVWCASDCQVNEDEKLTIS